MEYDDWLAQRVLECVVIESKKIKVIFGGGWMLNRHYPPDVKVQIHTLIGQKYLFYIHFTKGDKSSLDALSPHFMLQNSTDETKSV